MVEERSTDIINSSFEVDYEGLEAEAEFECMKIDKDFKESLEKIVSEIDEDFKESLDLVREKTVSEIYPGEIIDPSRFFSSEFINEPFKNIFTSGSQNCIGNEDYDGGATSDDGGGFLKYKAKSRRSKRNSYKKNVSAKIETF